MPKLRWALTVKSRKVGDSKWEYMVSCQVCIWESAWLPTYEDAQVLMGQLDACCPMCKNHTVADVGGTDA